MLFGECLGGALYVEDFIRICHKVGFADPRELSRDVIEVTDPELAELVGDTTFYSITYRAFKVPGLESLCEDYGELSFHRRPGPRSTLLRVRDALSTQPA